MVVLILQHISGKTVLTVKNIDQILIFKSHGFQAFGCVIANEPIRAVDLCAKNIKRLLDKTESKVSLGKKKKQAEEADATEAEDVAEGNKPMTASYRRQLNKKNKKGNKK